MLNHWGVKTLLPSIFGKEYIHTNKVWLYHLGVICSCIAVYWLSKLVRLMMNRMSFKKLFQSENE